MRQFVRPDELGGFLRTAYGSSRKLTAVERLAGGSKKGVYRLTMTDGATCILYVWSGAENCWPESGDDPVDPFADASGAELFAASHARLAALGVRTPAVLAMDRSHRHYPADLAPVEDVPGGSLAEAIERSADLAGPALDELAGMLAVMHRHHGTKLGKVALVEAGDAPQDRGPDRVVFDRALRHLSIVAGRVARLGAVRSGIEEHLRALAGAVAPRHEYGLIHGELGPDHVLLAADGRPVLIDIEGLLYFDVEWKHAFLRLRFGREYQRLAPAGLDEARLRYYEFAQSLSLIEGPLRIADGDFPERDFMIGLAAWHADKVLRLSELPPDRVR